MADLSSDLPTSTTGRRVCGRRAQGSLRAGAVAVAGSEELAQKTRFIATTFEAMKLFSSIVQQGFALTLLALMRSRVS